MSFLKRFLIAQGREVRFDLIDYVLDLEDGYLWIASYYDLGLILGTMTGPFARVVFFFPSCFPKGSNIYTCFEWKTNTWALKILQFGVSVWDYDWAFHPGSIFLSIYCEKETHLNFGEKEYLWLASYYGLGLILRVMTRPFTHVTFFFQFIVKRRRRWIFAKDEYLWLASYCELGVILRAMIRPFTQVAFLLQKRYTFEFWRKSSVYHLQAITAWENAFKVDRGLFCVVEMIWKMGLNLFCINGENG